MGELCGLHCATGIHCDPPKSLLINVIDPLTFTEAVFIKSILPLEEKITGPVKVKNVTISPGPSALCMVAIGVEEGFRPTECAP